MLIELVGGAACAAAGCMAYGVRSRSSNLFARSRWRGARDRRAIALTFDDGPSESTPPLLELLGLPQGYIPFGTFVIGYPTETYLRIPTRRPFDVTWR